MRVHIERLVLDGFAAGPGAAERWRAAVERELARALTADGVAAEGVAPPAGPVVLDLRDPARAAVPVAGAVAARVRAAGRGGEPGAAR